MHLCDKARIGSAIQTWEFCRYTEKGAFVGQPLSTQRRQVKSGSTGEGAEGNVPSLASPPGLCMLLEAFHFQYSHLKAKT